MNDGKKINAIIVDDEKGCITNLQHYIDNLCPEIKIIATGNTLKEVIDNTASQHIDLAFLDIELFDDNIFNSLNQYLPFDFKIVFVTAYQQYALKAIKVEALDYILKPLGADEINESYIKIKRHFQPGNELAGEDLASQTTKIKKIILKNLDNIYIIKADDIYYMSGNGFYTKVTFSFNNEVKSVMISKPLSKVETEYAHSSHFRVHKSYIVNTGKIDTIIKDSSISIKMLDSKIIPVAKRRASVFLSFLNGTN